VLRQGSCAVVMCIREGTLRQVPGFCKRASGASEAPYANSVVADILQVLIVQHSRWHFTSNSDLPLY